MPRIVAVLIVAVIVAAIATITSADDGPRYLGPPIKGGYTLYLPVVVVGAECVHVYTEHDGNNRREREENCRGY